MNGIKTKITDLQCNQSNAQAALWYIRKQNRSVKGDVYIVVQKDGELYSARKLKSGVTEQAAYGIKNEVESGKLAYYFNNDMEQLSGPEDGVISIGQVHCPVNTCIGSVYTVSYLDQYVGKNEAPKLYETWGL